MKTVVYKLWNFASQEDRNLIGNHIVNASNINKLYQFIEDASCDGKWPEKLVGFQSVDCLICLAKVVEEHPTLITTKGVLVGKILE